ncbi:MAG: DsrE family protein [Oceanospirillaceae bacterium]|nr:DsrE family protein [Oceanospirillaceae bacterium]
MQSVKVIFHIDEVEKWPLLLANVRNLVKVVDVSASCIAVLVNSKAVIIFDKQNSASSPNVAPASHSDLIQELVEQGVKFKLCQNSLKGFGIVAESLSDDLEVVPVGVLELIEKQADGFAYIKP